MMKLFLAASLVIACPIASGAQATPAQPSPAAAIVTEPRDSVVLKSSPELERAVQELAVAMQALALKVATDPRLRSAAIDVASGFISVAQQAVTEQSVVLQEALRNAAQKIAAVQAADRAIPRKP